jgi:hypothetical protein
MKGSIALTFDRILPMAQSEQEFRYSWCCVFLRLVAIAVPPLLEPSLIFGTVMPRGFIQMSMIGVLVLLVNNFYAAIRSLMQLEAFSF